MPAVVAFGMIWLGAVLVAVLDELAILLLSELELSALELRELVLVRLAAEPVDEVGVVPPLPPPQAVSAKIKKLAIKTGLINLIIVSGIGVAPLLSYFGYRL